MEVIQGKLYDHPKYYDVLFGSDCKAEYDFLRACFQKHALRPVRRLFEPACGTGRLLARFARAGYEVSGIDLNPKAVEYCNARLVRQGLPPTATVRDMADFRLRRKVDAAFNTINSFLHLDSEKKARSHLECVARALAKGGLYVLGFHLTPTRGQGWLCESWSARRGHLGVVSRMWSVDLDRRRRRERVGFTLDVYTPLRQFRLEDQLVFRTYTAAQFRRLLDRIPGLEMVGTYDFAYDIDQPIQIAAETEDVVFVLRKR
jgi:SAM-dependent methyltransferase